MLRILLFCVVLRCSALCRFVLRCVLCYVVLRCIAFCDVRRVWFVFRFVLFIVNVCRLVLFCLVLPARVFSVLSL